MGDTAGDLQVRKSSRKPVPKVFRNEYIAPVVPRKKNKKVKVAETVIKEETKDIPEIAQPSIPEIPQPSTSASQEKGPHKMAMLKKVVKIEEEPIELVGVIPQVSAKPQKYTPSIAVQKLRAMKSAAPHMQPTTAMIKKIMSDVESKEVDAPRFKAVKSDFDSDNDEKEFIAPKIEPCIIVKSEEQEYEETEMIRRVPSKIAIHTGLRNTFGTNDALLNRANQAQKNQPVLRKVVIKPLFNSRPPINLKMVRPEDIVGKINEHQGRPSASDAGIGKLTYQKIANYGRTNNVPATKPNIYRPPIGSSQPKTVPFYPTKLVVRPKFVYDLNVKTVVPKLPNLSFEAPEKRIKLEPGEIPYPLKPEKDEPVTFQSVFGKKYEGVPMKGSVTKIYENEKLSIANPALAARLAQIINFKKPPEKPKPEVKYADEFPEILRPISDNPTAFARKAMQFVPYYSNNDDARPSGPVSVDKSSMINFEPSLTDALNDSNRKTVRVTFNGITQEVPDEINCHLCGMSMRLCMRKSKYRGEIREYPAYRCLRKGCQTFRAIRKILEPDYAIKRHLPPTINKANDRSYDPEYILSSLMEMPESRKKIYSQELIDDVEDKIKEEAKPESLLDDEQEQEQEEEDVEWSELPKNESSSDANDEDGEVVLDDGNGEEETEDYNSEHDSYESHNPMNDVEMDDEDVFEVEETTVD